MSIIWPEISVVRRGRVIDASSARKNMYSRTDIDLNIKESERLRSLKCRNKPCTSASCRLKSPAYRLFVQQILWDNKGNFKTAHYSPSVRVAVSSHRIVAWLWCFLFARLHKLLNKQSTCRWFVLMMRCQLRMMTSSNGNIFRVTGPLWGESTGHRFIPITKASRAEFWCFLWSEQRFEQTIEKPVIWDAIALIITSL